MPSPSALAVYSGVSNETWTCDLRREIVDLVRLGLLHDADDIGRVGHVAIVQMEAKSLLMRIMDEVVDAGGIEGGRSALDAVDDIALGEQKLGQIGAVLSGHAGDEGDLGHWGRAGPGRRSTPMDRAARQRSRQRADSERQPEADREDERVLGRHAVADEKRYHRKLAQPPAADSDRDERYADHHCEQHCCVGQRQHETLRAAERPHDGDGERMDETSQP